MRKFKDLYSTGDVAKICGVTINTVVKWFEAGELEGRRTSRTGARRITRKSLFSFLKRQGFPPETAARERFRIIVVDDDKAAISLFRRSFRNDSGYMVNTTSSSFEAGLLAERLKPNVVFVDVNLKSIETMELAKHLRDVANGQDMLVVAVGLRLGEKRREELSKHFDAVLTKPLEASKMKKIIAACSS